MTLSFVARLCMPFYDMSREYAFLHAMPFMQIWVFRKRRYVSTDRESDINGWSFASLFFRYREFKWVDGFSYALS